MDGTLRWGLIISAAMVQTVAGAVYAMGAWQAPLRDALGLTADTVSLIGASTFLGSIVASFGGKAVRAALQLIPPLPCQSTSR